MLFSLQIASLRWPLSSTFYSAAFDVPPSYVAPPQQVSLAPRKARSKEATRTLLGSTDSDGLVDESRELHGGAVGQVAGLLGEDDAILLDEEAVVLADKRPDEIVGHFQGFSVWRCRCLVIFY